MNKDFFTEGQRRRKWAFLDQLERAYARGRRDSVQEGNQEITSHFKGLEAVAGEVLRWLEEQEAEWDRETPISRLREVLR